jgi:hypothetical protein
MERAIERMHVTTTAVVDEWILSDAFAALEESLRAEWASVRLRVLQPILKSKIMNLAAAAVIILAALVGVRLFVRSGDQQTIIDRERTQIAGMAAAHDIDGLVSMLSEGQFESQVFAAEHLGRIGDERALPELQKLYLAAEVHLPKGYKENPFAKPIEKIKNRMELEPDEPMTMPDVNEPIVTDVTKVTPTQVNEPDQTNLEVVTTTDVPAETPGAGDFNVPADKTIEGVTVLEANETAVIDVTEGPSVEVNEPAETNGPAETNDTQVPPPNVPQETRTTMDFYVVHKKTRFIKRPKSLCRACILISKSRGTAPMMSTTW